MILYLNILNYFLLILSFKCLIKEFFRALRAQRNRLANVNIPVVSTVINDSINSVDEDFDLPPLAPVVSSGYFLKIGTRVVPGQDWLWGNNNNGIIGTVIGVGKSGNGKSLFMNMVLIFIYRMGGCTVG